MIKNSQFLFCLFLFFQTLSLSQTADMTSAVEQTDLLFGAAVVDLQSDEVKLMFVCEKSYQPTDGTPATLIIHQGVEDKKGNLSTVHEEAGVTISKVDVAESGIAVTLTVKLPKKKSNLNDYLESDNEVFISWKKDLLIEHEIVKNENGKTIIDSKYFSGFPMGESIEYSSEDSITRENFSMLGQYHGEYKIYYNDTLLKRLNYFLGQLSGPEIWYHPNGNIRYEGENIDGLKEGSAKNYYEDGTLHTTGNFVNDTLEGEYVVYYKNGNKKESGKKHKGEYAGVCTAYYENGNIHFQQTKVDGLSSGPYFRNYESGKLEVKANWLNGELDGERIDYYENGKKKMQGKYKAGKQIGEWQYWDEQGEKRTEKFD